MNQIDFTPGQRWISNTELQLGLGTVLASDHRVVQISFAASGETRIYAKQSAPLTRVRFSEGDTIRAEEGWSLTVEQVEELGGLITYQGIREDGSQVQLPETQLSHLIQLNRAADRLLTGQIDKPRLFTLRQQTREQQNKLEQDPLYGLTGTRTSLIPHQLYIAHEVSRRYAPRVLLADEVGLGKTIEAGLIIHQQLLTERAHRILIVVPDTLVHQWLVEMLRKFNLMFSIFDAERCTAIEENLDADETINPFETEQLVICSLGFLTQHPQYFDQALSADWDCLVVDEAHHLMWSPEQSSIEYNCIEHLARSIPGVLLLTATPEQLGKTGHYARLRLLDPDRFPDYESFLQEEQHYQPVAAAIENLLAGESLSNDSLAVLNETLDEGDNKTYLESLVNDKADDSEREYARERLIAHLLDRHGTSRVLFRNTRHAIKGFPERTLLACPLPLPDGYEKRLALFREETVSEAQLLLCPELLYSAVRSEADPEWTDIDPRLPWLLNLLAQLKDEKVLLISASTQTALDIAGYLQSQSGIHAAVFHEGMNIVERDRAAAYFADAEAGTQVLVCSEIGSEGRNFQFSHNLVLFDLPLNPDLLEQRIGRLDRIGQQHTINIHAPFIEHSAQAIMLRWYQEGLLAFEQPCPAGQHVFEKVQTSLASALNKQDIADDQLDMLISQTREIYEQYNDALHQGRDRLLEYSSCRPAKAAQLIEHVLEQGHEKELNEFLDRAFDSFGIDSDIHSHTSLVITPSEHVRVNLPGLTEDGMTITTHRQTALSNEDIQYLSWEHPLVIAAMDSILGSEMGNTTMVTIKHKGLEQGTLLIECLYTLESATQKGHNPSRYLPASTIRVVIDHTGKQYTKQLGDDVILQSQSPIKAGIRTRVLQMHSGTLRNMLKLSNKLANEQVPELVQTARDAASRDMTREIDRLQALKTINPTIRDDELDYFRNERDILLQKLDESLPQLDAVRVMIVV